MKIFFGKVIAGFVVGAGAIIPGLSGGILAVSMGLYQPMIEAITGLVKSPKKNFLFLLPFGIGGAIGFVLFMYLLEWLFSDFRTAVICLFLGLVAGSIPAFLKEANGSLPFKKANLVYSSIFFVAALSIALLGIKSSVSIEESVVTILSPLQAFFCGGVVVLGTVIPGLSTSFILIYLGFYDAFLSTFTGLIGNLSANLLPAACTFAGMAVVAIPLIFVIRKLLNRFHCQSFYAIFGILVATMVGCVVQEIYRLCASDSSVGLIECVIYILLFIGGTVGSFYMEKGMTSLGIRSEKEKPSA